MVAGLALAVLATAAPVGAAGGKLKASLQLTPTVHSYGDVPTGASTPFTYTVTNAGAAASGPVSWSVTGRYASEFPVVTGGSGACASGVTALAAGASCTITVAFAPAGPLGRRTATLNVADGPGTGSPKASLSGNAVAPAALSLSPASHDFGQVTGGHGTQPFTFTVSNGGSAPSGPISFSKTGTDTDDFLAVSGATNECVSGTTSLAVGASCTIDVSFSPWDIRPYGPKSATLQISTPNSLEGAPSAALSGESTTPDVITISPTSHDFGDVTTGGSSTITFTVTNTGPQTSGEIHTWMFGTDAGQFSIDSPTNFCGAALAVGASCTFGVTFAPTSEGSKSAEAHVWTGATNGNSVATLAGTGTASAACAVGPDSGCITLDDVVVQEHASFGPPPTYGARQYTLSGSISFSPTCQNGSVGCGYSNYEDFFAGSGTFSFDDGIGGVISGTWTATYYTGQFPPSYSDANGATDCANAAIRLFFGVMTFTDGTDTWQANYIEIRTDTTAEGPYKNMLYMNGLTGPFGAQGNYHTSDISGMTISC